MTKGVDRSSSLRGGWHRATLSLWLAMLAAAAQGCLDPTQVELQITTDVRCDELDSVGITVGTPESVETDVPDTSTTGRCDNGYVGKLVLVPAAEDSAKIGIKVVAGVGASFEECQPPTYRPSSIDATCIVARRALSFVPHASLELPMVLRASCAGNPCSADTTCVDGVCRHRWVPDADSCADGRCEEGMLTACEVAHPCSGDVDGDELVSLGDLATVNAHLNTRCGDADFNPAADITGDYVVDGYDVLRVLVRYGCSCTELCTCLNEHPCPGDADGNGFIDEADFAIVDEALFTQCGEDNFNPTADFDNDFIVDAADFNIWNSHKFEPSDCAR